MQYHQTILCHPKSHYLTQVTYLILPKSSKQSPPTTLKDSRNTYHCDSIDTVASASCRVPSLCLRDRSSCRSSKISLRARLRVDALFGFWARSSPYLSPAIGLRVCWSCKNNALSLSLYRFSMWLCALLRATRSLSWSSFCWFWCRKILFGGTRQSSRSEHESGSSFDEFNGGEISWEFNSGEISWSFRPLISQSILALVFLLLKEPVGISARWYGLCGRL